MNDGTRLIAFAFALELAGCSQSPPSTTSTPPAAPPAAPPSAPAAPERPAPNPENDVYFGDVHVHTGWSFDAFTNGSKTTPTDAYAWAQGKKITGSGGPEMQIETPLDFYMVADHAEYMGVFNQMENPESPLSKTELAKGVTSPDPNVRMQTFAGVLRDMGAGKSDPQLSDPTLARSVWARDHQGCRRQLRARQVHHVCRVRMDVEPDKRNLHRVVVFRDTRTFPTS
jgi:hypothetical protein